MSNNTIDQYKSAAQRIFKEFITAFEVPYDASGDPGYWRLGNSFDTMTDYLWLLKESKNPSDNDFYQWYKTRLHGQLKETDWTQRIDPYAQYLRHMMKPKSSSCAYDDFCWWGIAFSKALPGSPYHDLYIDLFGTSLTTTFQNQSKYIWEVVFNGNYNDLIEHAPKDYPTYSQFHDDFSARHKYHGGSPNVWTRVTENNPPGLKATFDNPPIPQLDVKPMFDGGLWQYDYYMETFPDTCGLDGNPNHAPMSGYIGPYQLTLMNSLGLIFSSRLHLWTGEAEGGQYISAAAKVKTFLSQWFQLPQDSGYNLLWHYDNAPEKALLRERMGKYASGQKVPGYEMITDPSSKRVWCGDQGLMLAALNEFAAATGKTDTLPTVAQVVRGTLDASGPLFKDVIDGNSFEILQPYSPAADGTDWFKHLFRYPDYWSGTGVFWRYLFQACRNGNAEIQQIVGTTLSSADNVITRSADAAVAASQPISPSDPAALVGPHLPWGTRPWSTKDWGESSILFKWFNSLAALTAAIYVLEDVPNIK